MRPIEPLEICPIVVGCSPPSLCDVTLDEFLCSVRNLLPPGEIWRRNVAAQDALYSRCLTLPSVIYDPSCEPLPPQECPKSVVLPVLSPVNCDPCLPTQGSVLVGLVDSIATTQYQLFCYLCTLAQEADPCLSTETVDAQFDALGFSECLSYDLCNACFEAMPGELELAVKKIVLCLSERLNFGEVINLALLQEILALFGYRAEMLSIGDLNCETLSNLYLCDSPRNTKKLDIPNPLGPFGRAGLCTYPFDCDDDCEPPLRCWSDAVRALNQTYTPIDTNGCFFQFDCDPEPCWNKSSEFGLRLCRTDVRVPTGGCLDPVRAVLPADLIVKLFRPGCSQVGRPLTENLLLGIAICLVEKLLPVNSRRFIEADCCPVCE